MAKVFKRLEESELTPYSTTALQEHQELIDAGVLISHLVVFSDGGYAVTMAGARCAAKTRKCGPRERLLTGFDAMVEIDGELWDGFSDAQRTALLDHEYEHLEVCLENGAPVFHKDGRPKLALKPDDWVLTGFYSVAERHGADAIEAMSMLATCKRAPQGVFPWFADAASKRPKIVAQA